MLNFFRHFSLSNVFLSFRTLPWLSYFYSVGFPLFLLFFSLFLKWLFLDLVYCAPYTYNGNIYVIDSMDDEIYSHFYSWLVHTDIASQHLGLSEDTIEEAITYCNPVISPTWLEDLYITEYSIESIEWSILITRHPEVVHSGVSCILDYYADHSLQGYIGPRESSITISEFLTTYC